MNNASSTTLELRQGSPIVLGLSVFMTLLTTGLTYQGLQYCLPTKLPKTHPWILFCLQTPQNTSNVPKKDQLHSHVGNSTDRGRAGAAMGVRKVRQNSFAQSRQIQGPGARAAETQSRRTPQHRILRHAVLQHLV